LGGYGLARRERTDFIDKMVAFAVHDARAEAVESGITLETSATDGAYPYA
jgi:hypothetical protein